MTTLNQLIDHLTTYGWTPSASEENTLLVTFLSDDEAAAFPITIQVEDAWVRMTIPVFLPEAPAETWPEVAQLAFQISNENRMARFVMLGNGQLAVCNELYAPNDLPYEQFEVALDTLTYLAEHAQPRLLALLNGNPDPGDWDETQEASQA
jgi:hypothetical protein